MRALCLQVNGGGLAEKAGLHVGDALIKVNNVDVSDMRHKDAQDTLVKAGNSFELSVQRGPQSTWRPQVATVGSLPMPGGASPQNVTRTSLTKPRQPTTPIGSGHNISPRPFASTPQVIMMMNGGLFNKQYNSPVGIYSEETIAETLSAQAEVLAGGVLGVNFKKNEKTYDSQKSEVYKMVQEVDKEPKEPEPAMSHTKFFSTISHAVGGRATSPRPRTPIAQQLGTPQPPQDKPYMPPQSPHPSGSPQCTDCGKSIVGIFVRIKDKNLHVECFKCATCGTSLKNVGYYNINNKLYCDIHAKLVARQNPPAPNMDPITVPPGVRTPVGALTTSAAANISSPTPSSPQHGTLAPLPFHAPRLGTSHVSVPRLGPQTQSAPTGPKPFGSQPVAAPPTPASVPFNVQSAAPMSTFGMKPQSTAMKVSSLTTSLSGVGGVSPGSSSGPNTGGGGPRGTGTIAGSTAPRRGRGVLNTTIGPGARIPICGQCNNQIRGPFITALGKIWCPEHFLCVNAKCRRPLQDLGFVEESEGLYCEYCFEQYLAPTCSKCNNKIKGDCLNAIGKQFHPECFSCAYCGKLFGNNPFFLEDSLPYCENDWNELFTTKCFSCGFPIEAGDRWVEALNNNYHSQCFNCTMCKKNLEGQSFFAKGGRPFCKNHAR
ncbi:hypothetical protein AAG570_008546 [Ranatra chinensis]|uniref:PDZ and LIM domain protein Zasp n=1 Tax=Ranatra chinensis TaxID=642074 RepID=A0ABD0YR75_9HEMI